MLSGAFELDAIIANVCVLWKNSITFKGSLRTSHTCGVTFEIRYFSYLTNISVHLVQIYSLYFTIHHRHKLTLNRFLQVHITIDSEYTWFLQCDGLKTHAYYTKQIRHTASYGHISYTP